MLLIRLVLLLVGLWMLLVWLLLVLIVLVLLLLLLLWLIGDKIRGMLPIIVAVVGVVTVHGRPSLVVLVACLEELSLLRFGVGLGRQAPKTRTPHLPSVVFLDPLPSSPSATNLIPLLAPPGVGGGGGF